MGVSKWSNSGSYVDLRNYGLNMTGVTKVWEALNQAESERRIEVIQEALADITALFLCLHINIQTLDIDSKCFESKVVSSGVQYTSWKREILYHSKFAVVVDFRSTSWLLSYALSVKQIRVPALSVAALLNACNLNILLYQHCFRPPIVQKCLWMCQKTSAPLRTVSIWQQVRAVDWRKDTVECVLFHVPIFRRE